MRFDHCSFMTARASRLSRIREGAWYACLYKREGWGMATMTRQSLGSADVAELVRRAADGDRRAWERLVDQFARLIWSITADFKLVESDAADVAQTTWLRLLEH